MVENGLIEVNDSEEQKVSGLLTQRKFFHNLP